MTSHPDSMRAPGSAHALSLLIVEDDPGYQELYRLVFRQYHLAVCSSGEEALAKVDQEAFDLVISDINLTGVSGLKLLEKMKQAGLSEHVPIILCSSQSDPATRQCAMDGGAAGFIVKPFRCEAIQQLVQTLLKTAPR